MFEIQISNTKAESVKTVSVYETFKPFRFILCLCGFWYNGGDAGENFSICREVVKFLFSIFYSTIFVIFFWMNLFWGEREPESSKSFLLNEGWHKLHLFELSMMPIIIWNNFYHRHQIDDCMRLLDKYDIACQVGNNEVKRTVSLVPEFEEFVFDKYQYFIEIFFKNVFQQRTDWKIVIHHRKLKKIVIFIAIFNPLWTVFR